MSTLTNRWFKPLAIMAMLVIIAMIAYLLIDSKFYNLRLFHYVLSLRIPTLIAIMIASICIAGASIIFQSIINNRIVTPCLLGMNAMYTLIHTTVIFMVGSSSIWASNAKLSFALDLIIMVIIATFVYSYLFKKTNHNVLYVLLIGTVLTSFFGSIQSTMVRIMDPNEYDVLLTSLVPDFNHVNEGIIGVSFLLLIGLIIYLRPQLKLLDAITLGKAQAINLGVDYDRTIRKLLFGVVIAIAIATAMVGPLSFLGLIIANLARQSMKTYRHTYLIIASILIGMITIIFGQIIMEHCFAFAIPLSTFITIFGGIYFLILLLNKKGVSI